MYNLDVECLVIYKILVNKWIEAEEEQTREKVKWLLYIMVNQIKNVLMEAFCETKRNKHDDDYVALRWEWNDLKLKLELKS